MAKPVAEIGQSYSPESADQGGSEADRKTVTVILSAIGTSVELAEELPIDLTTALPGSGAAYPALMDTAMARFMIEQGVPPYIV